MNSIETIKARRSIRRFKNKTVDRDLIEELLEVTVNAPSGKNLQPWHFTIIEGQKKDQIVQVLKQGVQHLKQEGLDTGSAEQTAKSMEQAPVIILVYNTEARPDDDHSGFNRYKWLVDIQSIGGAIQTLLLAATEKGLGSLWICDVFFAEQEISKLLKRDEELVAAVAIGYTDEKPAARPRKSWQEVTNWIS